jgi:hypothetical protein
MVKPATNLSRNQLNTKAIGTATRHGRGLQRLPEEHVSAELGRYPGADGHLRGRGPER